MLLIHQLLVGIQTTPFLFFYEDCIDCIVFNAVFNSISVIFRRPVHLSMLSSSSFKRYCAQCRFQATGCFSTQPLSKQRTAVREEWILSQWLSSILGKNIGRAEDRTTNLLFSSPQRYRLRYEVRLFFEEETLVIAIYVSHTASAVHKTFNCFMGKQQTSWKKDNVVASVKKLVTIFQTTTFWTFPNWKQIPDNKITWLKNWNLYWVD